MLFGQIDRLRDAAIRDSQIDLYERDQANEGPPFPERSHINAIMARHQLDVAAAIDTWATWATAEVQRWPHDLSLPADVHELLARAFARPASSQGDGGDSMRP